MGSERSYTPHEHHQPTSPLAPRTFKKMFQALRKRRKAEETPTRVGSEVKFSHVTLYLVERKMGTSRRNFLSDLARSKGFCVDNTLSGRVTHVVSERNSDLELWKWLEDKGYREKLGQKVLDINWFTESMSAGRPVNVETRHLIRNPCGETKPCMLSSKPNPEPLVSPYACKRTTPLQNHNKNFTDALEVLAENSEFIGNTGPCLAFLRAVSVLKSLPTALSCLEDAQYLPCLGKHSNAIIGEIFKFGASSKVEEILNDERYLTLKLFNSVFGVGPKTAESWYCQGLRTFEHVLTEPRVKLNRMQMAGFMFYDDITEPVSRTEAGVVQMMVEEAVGQINSTATVAITGGFRRGKDCGHDVDFLIKTLQAGQEDGLLPAIIQTFKRQNILLYSDYQPSTLGGKQLPSRRFEAMDHFHKCFLIVKVKRVWTSPEGSDGAANRDWKAIRVDLVAPPLECFAYALLGWTGSTMFDRDLRRFARLERGKLLDNHALYDKATNSFIPALTEEDIFNHLGLEFIEPWQRNA